MSYFVAMHITPSQYIMSPPIHCLCLAKDDELYDLPYLFIMFVLYVCLAQDEERCVDAGYGRS